eukprot:364959-Chlamydomonas_euryale.AAC.8
MAHCMGCMTYSFVCACMGCTMYYAPHDLHGKLRTACCMGPHAWRTARAAWQRPGCLLHRAACMAHRMGCMAKAGLHASQGCMHGAPHGLHGKGRVACCTGPHAWRTVWAA